jgi:thioredoxin-like negative regulator of GroEL
MEINFYEEVLSHSSVAPVVVKFSATWCAPCKALEPKLRKVIGDRIKLVELDIEEHLVEAQRFNVRSVPLTIAFVSGEQVAAFNGDKPESWLVNFIEEVLSK